MITLTLNYPLDKLGFPIRPDEEHHFNSLGAALDYLVETKGWSSYIIVGVKT